MKIKSDLRAGMTFEECDIQRDKMKAAAQAGKCSYLNPPTPYPPTKPTYPPTTPTTGGGYYGGVYYPDRSYSCG